jgi:GNAT superfamily N-acetyltransferase
MSERENRATVRRATADDIPTLVEHRVALRLEAHERSADAVRAFRAATAVAYTELVAAGEFIAWIAECDGEVVGSVGAFIRRTLPNIDGPPCEARVQSMYIVPDRRRGGIGTALMRALLAEMRARSVRRVYLRPSPSGRRFYPAFGFEPCDEMELYP